MSQPQPGSGNVPFELAQPSPHQSGADQSGGQEDAMEGARDTVEMGGIEAKPFEAKESLMIRPYYLDMKTQKLLNNSYPTLSKVLAQGTYPAVQTLLAAEGDDEGMDPPEMIQTDPALAPAPPMEVAPGAGGDEDPAAKEAEKAANMEKLGITSPEEFAAKFKGQIQQLAEEHGIGDPLAYSFRTRKIELIGTDAVLLLDYDMKALHTRPMYPVESEEESTVELSPEDVEELDEEETEEQEAEGDGT
jgi:hypothetical protein